MRIYTILKLILGKLNVISNRKNSVYYSEGSIVAPYQQVYTSCNLTIPTAGVYLVLGHQDANLAVDTILLSAIRPERNVSIIAYADGRSSMLGGGGCISWALVNASANGEVFLQGYGYAPGTWTSKGKLLAIKLI